MIPLHRLMWGRNKAPKPQSSLPAIFWKLEIGNAERSAILVLLVFNSQELVIFPHKNKMPDVREYVNGSASVNNLVRTIAQTLMRDGND